MVIKCLQYGCVHVYLYVHVLCCFINTFKQKKKTVKMFIWNIIIV